MSPELPTVTLSTESENTQSFVMPELSPDQTLFFQLTVTDNNGDTASDTVAIDRVKEISLLANVTSGIAPLKVHFIVESNSPNPVNNYGMDYDGEGNLNGVIDETSTDPSVFQHTYEAVGVYRPYVFLLDELGNEYFDQITIEVVSTEDEQALMKSIWDAMVAALMNGDVEEALTYFTEGAQHEYQAIFGNMDSDKINAIFANVSDLQLRSLADNIGQCAAIRDEPDGTYAYHIRFVKTDAGVWKLVSM